MPPIPRPTPAPPDAPRTGRLRLLEALDALLMHGGVSEAARALTISPPAMSRLLAQLRAHYGDPLLVRAGSRGMMPTPFAQMLRERVHAVTQSAGALLELVPGSPASQPCTVSHCPADTNRHPPRAGAALHVFGKAQHARAFPPPRTSEAPAPDEFVARREGWSRDSDPQTRLAGLISTLAGGQATGRALHRTEAADALAIILRGEAQAVQIGAFLAALQARGLSGEELAGLVTAARATLAPAGAGDVTLDWPAYTSPRNQRVPWFLLAVKALAQAGFPVALHGPGQPGDTRLRVVQSLGIPQAATIDDAHRHLTRTRCVYVPLGVISAQLQAITGLYPALGMRNAAHLVAQMLDPFGARATILGTPAQQGAVHRDAMVALGGGRFLGVSTHRDIAQATPHRLLRYALVDAGVSGEGALPAITHRRPPGMVPGQRAAEICQAVWDGELLDPAVHDVVVDTIALGLIAAEAADSAAPDAVRAMARDLWAARA
ncbi:MAG TPA: LysR family transcriptional regulator [Paracoccus sp.]|nr:LysR family transcriptional regulator [Paracoccus sp. (in: a-proteobacteria)]